MQNKSNKPNWTCENCDSENPDKKKVCEVCSEERPWSQIIIEIIGINYI